MILNVLDSIWNKLIEWTDYCHDYVVNHFDEPFFWIIIVAVLLVITYAAISNLGSK